MKSREELLAAANQAQPEAWDEIFTEIERNDSPTDEDYKTYGHLLFSAVDQRNEQVIAKLLQAGADCSVRERTRGPSPVECLVCEGDMSKIDLRCVEVFIAHAEALKEKGERMAALMQETDKRLAAKAFSCSENFCEQVYLGSIFLYLLQYPEHSPALLGRLLNLNLNVDFNCRLGADCSELIDKVELSVEQWGFLWACCQHTSDGQEFFKEQVCLGGGVKWNGFDFFYQQHGPAIKAAPVNSDAGSGSDQHNDESEFIVDKELASIYGECLYFAARGSDADRIRQLVLEAHARCNFSAPAAVVARHSENNETFNACIGPFIERARLIQEAEGQQACADFCRDADLGSVLLAALKNQYVPATGDDLSFVSVLLDLGVKTNFKCSDVQDNRTDACVGYGCLHFAVRDRKHDDVALLLQHDTYHYVITATVPCRDTPLQLAFKQGDVELCRLLGSVESTLPEQNQFSTLDARFNFEKDKWLATGIFSSWDSDQWICLIAFCKPTEPGQAFLIERLVAYAHCDAIPKDELFPDLRLEQFVEFCITANRPVALLLLCAHHLDDLLGLLEAHNDLPPEFPLSFFTAMFNRGDEGQKALAFALIQDPAAVLLNAIVNGLESRLTLLPFFDETHLTESILRAAIKREDFVVVLDLLPYFSFDSLSFAFFEGVGYSAVSHLLSGLDFAHPGEFQDALNFLNTLRAFLCDQTNFRNAGSYIDSDRHAQLSRFGRGLFRALSGEHDHDHVQPAAAQKFLEYLDLLRSESVSDEGTSTSTAVPSESSALEVTSQSVIDARAVLRKVRYLQGAEFENLSQGEFEEVVDLASVLWGKSGSKLSDRKAACLDFAGETPVEKIQNFLRDADGSSNKNSFKCALVKAFLMVELGEDDTAASAETLVENLIGLLGVSVVVEQCHRALINTCGSPGAVFSTLQDGVQSQQILEYVLALGIPGDQKPEVCLRVFRMFELTPPSAWLNNAKSGDSQADPVRESILAALGDAFVDVAVPAPVGDESIFRL